MAEEKYVEDGDYISDDSSFYGDVDLKAELRQASTRHRKPNLEPPVPLPPYRRTRLAGEASIGFANRAHINVPEQERTTGAAAQHINSTVKVDHFKEHPAAWQQDESIQNFLRRLPADDPSSAQVGHWLWVGSPTVPRIDAERRKSEDSDAFAEAARSLLDGFKQERGKVERDNPNKSSAVLTRKMSPHRDRLESDLLSLAIDTGTTCGKWMLFPKPQELSKVWATVAAATADCKLGPMSKVATGNAGDDSTLICVYTYDFSNLQDVCRVLNQLAELGLVFADGKPIFYKCDAYTFLRITSNNDYKLRASLYNSTDILHNDRKALESGPVGRLAKNKGLTQPSADRIS